MANNENYNTEEQAVKKWKVRDKHGHVKKSGSLAVVGSVNVEVDSTGGDHPTADSAYQNGQLDITLHDIKGERGNGITEIDVEESQVDDAYNVVRIHCTDDESEQGTELRVKNGKTGNGITGIVTAESQVDGGNNTVTIKTTDNPTGVTFNVKNGKTGNGIASITEHASTEDGGVNEIIVKHTDPSTQDVVLHVRNGRTGKQGDSAIWDENEPHEKLTDIANVLGGSTVMPMSQKKVTEEYCVEGENIKFANLASKDYYITQENKWSQQMGDAANCKFVPVSPGEIFRLTAQSEYYTHYAFLNSGQVTANQRPSFADNVTGRTKLAEGSSQIVVAPSNANWLYVTTILSGNNVVPQVTVLGSLKEKTSKIEEKVDALYAGKAINTYSLTNYNYYINGSREWEVVNNGNAQCKLIPIEPNQSFTIIAKSDLYASVAFLQNNNITHGQTPSFAGRAAGRIIVSAGGQTKITAPDDANWLYIMTKLSGEDNEPQVLMDVPAKEVLSGSYKSIKCKMQNNGLNANNGRYVTGGYRDRFSTAKMYRVPFDRVVSFIFSTDSNNSNNATGVKICGYDKNMKFVSSRSGLEMEKGVPSIIEMELTWEYFKTEITVAPIGEDLYPDIVELRIEGNFSSDCEKYNIPQYNPDANGNWMLPLTLAIDTATPTTQDTETATITDDVNIQFDHGILALPSSYTAEGEPTRLIIFCHGSAKHITNNATTFPTGEYGVDPTYWLSEGYAVMDMDGLPDNTTMPHWCVPVAYQCYLAAYRFAVANYNISKEIFLGGRSLGGGMALTIMAMGHIPVIACCPFTPPGPYSALSFYTKTAEEKQMIADACGIYNPGNVPWSANDFNKEVLMMESTEINGNEKYIGNFGRLMQFSPSYRLAVNNPLPSVLTDDRMFSNGKSYIQEVYGAIAVKTNIPVKFFGAYDDETNRPWTTNLWVQMFRNGGCITEHRMFPTGNHSFDLAAANKVAEFVNSKGDTLEDVPIAYIEALQFWRRYE